MGEVLYRSSLESPIGKLELMTTKNGLAVLHLGRLTRRRLEGWARRCFPDAAIVDARKEHRLLAGQLREYFSGRRRIFDIPLDMRGSEFQKAVWTAVANIPFGSTVTYGEIAHLMGRPRASRAVGAANGANPIPIVVPCHRVIGSNGSLTGYGGGLARKRWLLAHEGVLGAEPVQMGLFRSRSVKVGK
jgi:O-6-methylguanine DNA methyltransferase